MGSATGEAPFSQRIARRVPAVGTAGNDSEVVFDLTEYTGAVSTVTYYPDADITGADNNSRTVTLYNRKGDGSGTTKIAELALTNGVTASKYVGKTITLQAAANLDVAAGDVLAWKSLHVGTGITDPGGLVVVTIARD